MAATNIEWTDEVWNPTTGCSKISQGCKNCYAEKMHKRLMHIRPEKYAHAFLDGAYEHKSMLTVPFKWKKPRMVFVNSMSDLFHKDISVDFIAAVYATMLLNEQHTFQVLTKRADRARAILNSKKFWIALLREYKWQHGNFIGGLSRPLYTEKEIAELWPFKNVWQGVSVEDDLSVMRVYELLNTPARVRWISAEPLLENITHELWVALRIANNSGKKISWIVVGGESGHKRRPFNPDWAREIRDVCKETQVKFFMKQMDKKTPIPPDLLIREMPEIINDQILV